MGSSTAEAGTRSRTESRGKASGRTAGGLDGWTNDDSFYSILLIKIIKRKNHGDDQGDRAENSDYSAFLLKLALNQCGDLVEGREDSDCEG